MNEILLFIGVQLITAGVFIGVTKTSLNDIKLRLQRIEDKEDKQNEEISDLRERVAVIESVLRTKKP